PGRANGVSGAGRRPARGDEARRKARRWRRDGPAPHRWQRGRGAETDRSRPKPVGKHVPTVGAKRQRLSPNRQRRVERSVKVREQLAAARRFVAQRIAKRLLVHRDQYKTILPGEVAGGGLPCLVMGREVD